VLESATHDIFRPVQHRLQRAQPAAEGLEVEIHDFGGKVAQAIGYGQRQAVQ
jgi:hypothetical protein